MARGGPTGPGGLVIVDKPAGMTSHDVVGKVRRIAHTRRVGHAGTLDPMATGVLVLGVERATRLLNHLVLTDKTYLGTIRLGAATSTDDATGEVLDGVLLGAGDNAMVRTITLLSAGLGFIPLCLLSLPLHWGIGGVWAGLAAFIVLRLVGMSWRTGTGRWLVVGERR